MSAIQEYSVGLKVEAMPQMRKHMKNSKCESFVITNLLTNIIVLANMRYLLREGQLSDDQLLSRESAIGDIPELHIDRIGERVVHQ